MRLYAEFERAKLLSFLKSSNSFYSLHEALEECRQRNFIPEMVYLLGRCSNSMLCVFDGNTPNMFMYMYTCIVF